MYTDSEDNRRNGDERMITKDKAMEMLVAISQIEGYLIGLTDIQRPAMVYDNLDLIVKELVEYIKGSIDE